MLERQRAFIDDHLVVVGETLRQHRHWATHNWVEFLRLILLNIIGLTEEEERQRKVYEGVLKLCDIIEALGELEDLIADNTSDHGGSGCDGRDDLASDHLGLVTVTLVNLIITSTKIRACVYEVDVEILIVIFLEVGGNKGVTWQRRSGNAERVEQLNNDRLIIVAFNLGCGCGTASSLTFLDLFRGLHYDNLLDVWLGGKITCDVPCGRAVDRWHAEVSKDQIRTVVYKVDTELVVCAKGERMRRSFRARPERLTTRSHMVIWE